MAARFSCITLLLLSMMASSIALATPENEIYLQAGTFKSLSNAQNYQQKLSKITHYPVTVEAWETYHVVRVGPIPTAAEGKALASTLPGKAFVRSRTTEPASVLVPLDNRKKGSVKANADVMNKNTALLPKAHLHPWSLIGSLGYSYFQQAGDNSGHALTGRFALGKELYTSGNTHAGFEIGIQNGNRMSISASQETLDLMGSLPIWTTVKPMMDLLATIKVAPMENRPAFFIFKGGMAYRQWETERQSINNLSQIAGELQAGIGVSVVDMAMLSLVYQGIYGGNTNFTVNPDTSGHVSNIPVQNGILLSLSLTL